LYILLGGWHHWARYYTTRA